MGVRVMAGGEHTNGIVGDDLSSSFERGCCLDGFTDVGTTPSGSGLSPTVEPASSLDGSATSIPSAAFLREAANYFERRPTGGEDRAHWANVFNAQNCREAAAFIELVVVVLEECADDLEAEVRDRWCYCDGEPHPGLLPKYERDMGPVRRARQLIARAQAIETRSAETAGLSPQGESAVVEDHAPGA